MASLSVGFHLRLLTVSRFAGRKWRLILAPMGVIPVFHSGKRLFLMEWTANGKRCVNHYLQGMPPFSLSQYKSWLSKIAALQSDFDAASVGK